jgi:hypothetical protein
MNWLRDIVWEILVSLIPWNSHHDDRSIVGKSRLDHQTRWIVRGFLFLGGAGLAGLWFFLKK